ncbi:hypothetical protein HC776_02040 [bacterium]|nr:hypothetical protein [bacterium]
MHLDFPSQLARHHSIPVLLSQIDEGLNWLEQESGTPWFFDNRFTQADVTIACMLMHLKLRIPEAFPANKFPKLHALALHCETLDAFANVPSNGKIAMKLPEGVTLVNAAIADDTDDVMLVTSLGRAIRFSTTEIRVFKSRGSTGVRGIRVGAGDRVVSMAIIRHWIHRIKRHIGIGGVLQKCEHPINALIGGRTKIIHVIMGRDIEKFSGVLLNRAVINAVEVNHQKPSVLWQ